MTIVGILTSLSASKMSSHDTRALFVYGTLRADYLPNGRGDRWGVTKGNGCRWEKATIYGFKLYQNPHLDYPFVVRTDDEEDKVVGTLLQWPSEDMFFQKLNQCDHIEGFNPRNPSSGLYQRDIVVAQGEDKKQTPAYVYHQSTKGNDGFTSKDLLAFPFGDWLQSAEL
mmetsp:Transcript_41216/g.96653  ORF Transcript_41216/g.96653 Transcript_41216/m.96653 type:complete len:169 (-) Transcript_41216:123-629(-)